MKQTVIFAGLLALMLTAGLVRADQVDVSKLTLVGIAEVDGVTYASLYDARNGEHFLTSSKGADERFELVGVTENESATIRQNGQTFLLRLSWSTEAVPVESEATTPVVQNIPQPGSVEATAPKPPEGGKLPLVFQVGNLSKLDLSDDQKATITRLRQQFVGAIGGGSAAVASPAVSLLSGQDAATPATPAASTLAPVAAPVDPPYQNWLTAQEKSDADFKMLFGQQAFNLSQMGPQSK